ncbi:hypothetical protein L9F63_010350, partial [Diploptera punctata]
MGKKNKTGNLGRALIKDRFGSSNSRRNKNSSLLHTAEVDDGYDWGRLNLQSVTEESSFQEFLSTAELAGTEFQAEKLNITFVNPKSRVGLLSGQEIEKVRETQDKNRQLLGIPRRPNWDCNTTPEELQAAERDAFLEWRRRLAQLQETDGLILTPYEKNIEFWKQLWRVVERSDLVVQIVDARNPLLFRCEDLEKYVKEVCPHKQNLVLLNKADFLTPAQRQAWTDYFNSLDVKVAFFSATLAADEDDDDEQDEEENVTESSLLSRMNVEKIIEEIKEIPRNKNRTGKHENNQRNQQQNTIITKADKGNQLVIMDKEDYRNRMDKVLASTEYIEVKLTHFPKVNPGVTTVGLVGYPNVGKSSTINALLTYKKVSVSATPGKTKHFQTLYLNKDLVLCDCPGLVMPSFVFTKAEMVVNGILPIDHMRDHVPPVTLVATLIPRRELEHMYGIMLPPPRTGEDPTRPPTSEELLDAYGYNRGFMTQNGQPDNPRSARYVLKDFVNGKLLYCHAPPGCDQAQYHIFPERTQQRTSNTVRHGTRSTKGAKVKGTAQDLDVQLLKEMMTVHIKEAQNTSRNMLTHALPGSATSLRHIRAES